MIVPAKVARGIVLGKVTEERRPVFSDDPPFKVAQRVAIQTSATKPARCHVKVTALGQEPRRAVDFAAARACGYQSVDEFMEAWFDRWGKDSPDLAWVIDFRLDIADDVHLLHKNSSKGYTHIPSEAMPGEPEAVAVGDLSPAWLEASAARHGVARRGDPEHIQRVARVTANRVREALISRGRAGADVDALAEQLSQLL